MSYNPSIPQADDLLTESQGAIQTNFTELNNIFEQDHVEYDNATTVNRGKHKRSTYIDSSDPANDPNELALYSKDVGGNSRLFMRQENSGTVIQLSGIDPVNATNGLTYLPGNMLLQWSTFTASGGGNTEVTFLTPFAAIPYAVICQMNRDSSTTTTIYAHTLAVDKFQARNTSGANRTTYYMAIGSAV